MLAKWEREMEALLSQPEHVWLHGLSPEEAAERMKDDPLSLKEVLHWGWHAAALYAYAALRPHREELDSWLWDYLAAGTERLDAERDARWEER